MTRRHARNASSRVVCEIVSCITMTVGSCSLKETDMEYTHVPNINLLARLIGTRAAKRLYRGMLDHLFRPEGEPSRHHETLAVARELVSRWLAEELKRGDALASPETVREYLCLLFAGEEREVFVALFLDTQHRLI